MKTMHHSQYTMHRWLRQGWRVLALFILSFSQFLNLSAQDAFYVYRNDGDFNGFFYDEVVRMGFSKTDLEGVEHEEYVIKEIETADSLYRIPLCAIDSIGFQQPEIKINPNVRILSRCGLLEYLIEVNDMLDPIYLTFQDLPSNLMPKVGDILIGLESDHSPHYPDQGFSCVVDDVWKSGGGITNVQGHYITNQGEVFEQFITVEDITVDPEGNVRRRLAGWDPEKVKHNEKGSTSDVYLIDKTLNFGKEWEYGSAKVGINAELGIKMKMRATYDIDLWRFYIKLNSDLYGYVEPSLSLSVSGDFFDKSVDDLITLPEIIFPAACPIFGVDPYPTLFLKAGGEISAKLTLPKAEMDIVQEITFDNDQDFPISYDIHRDPKENALGADFINFNDANSNVKFTGTAQAGIRLGCSIGMAGWLQKIIKGNVGLYANIGPQVVAQMEFQSNWLNNEGFSEDVYDWLRVAEVDVSKLVVGIEAKATARVLWGEEKEETFLSKSWEFFCDTLHIVPEYKIFDAKYDHLHGLLKVKERAMGKVFVPNLIGIRLYNENEQGEWENMTTDWSSNQYFFMAAHKDSLDFSSDFEKLKAGVYRTCPMVMIAGKEVAATPYMKEVEVTPYLNIDTLVNAEGDAHKEEMFFESNVTKASNIILESRANWITGAKVVDFNAARGNGNLEFHVKDNIGTSVRDGYILVIAKAGESRVFETYDTIHVVQKGKIPILKISQDKVKAGSGTSQLQVEVETNLKGIEIKNDSKWNKASLSAPNPETGTMKLTIDVTDNKSILKRGNDIVLSVAIGDTLVADTLHVSQDASPAKSKATIRFDLDPHMKGSDRSWGSWTTNRVAVGLEPYSSYENNTEYDGRTSILRAFRWGVDATCSSSSDRLTITGHVDLTDGWTDPSGSWTATSDNGEERSSTQESFESYGHFTLVVDISEESVARIVSCNAEVKSRKRGDYSGSWATWSYPDQGNRYLEVVFRSHKTLQEDKVVKVSWDVNPDNYDKNNIPCPGTGDSSYGADPVSSLRFDFELGSWAEASIDEETHQTEESNWPENGDRDYSESHHTFKSTLVPDGEGYCSIDISWE